MAGLGDLETGLVGIEGLQGRLDRPVLGQGGGFPGRWIHGVGPAQRECLFQVLKGFGVFPSQAGQLFAGHVELVFRGDALAFTVVIAGAGLVHLGDGDKPHIKTFLGLLILPLDRGLGGPGRGDRVLGPEHIEVGRGDIQDQLLLGQIVLRPSGFGLKFARVIAEPGVRLEQRLGQLNTIAGGLVTFIHQFAVDIVVVGFGVGTDLRQQRTSGDFTGGLLGLVAGLGRGDTGIVGQGLFVGFHQIQGKGRLGRHEADQSTKQSFLHSFS